MVFRETCYCYLSTIEAEFVAATVCACQAIWLRKILECLYFKQEEAATIYCDNGSTIKLSKNLVLHGWSKHIDGRYHFLRDLTKEGVISSTIGAKIKLLIFSQSLLSHWSFWNWGNYLMFAEWIIIIKLINIKKKFKGVIVV